MSTKRSFIYRSFWPEPKALEKFSNLGIGNFCLFPANTVNAFGQPYSLFPDVWTGIGTYNFQALDEHIRLFLDTDPEAKLIVMIDLNTPLWWTHYRRKSDTFVELGRISHDPQWRQDTLDYVHAFLDYTETKYSHNVGAYLLSCGGTSEWFDRSYGVESPSRTAALKEWCQTRHIADLGSVPAGAERENFTHDDFLRDPVADRQAIRYWKFINDQNADTLLYFAEKVKGIVRPEVELGAFFGYIKRGPNRLVSDGHLAYERVFASDLLDFFVAPSYYHARNMGEGSGHVVPLGSIHRHNKTFINELDHFTHTANLLPYQDKGFNQPLCENWKNETETICGIKREFAISLIENTSLWLFDMWGHWFEGAGVDRTIKKCLDIWNESSAKTAPATAEIAVIFDPDSAVYMNQNSALTDGLIRGVHDKMRLIGTPFEEYSFNDLENLDLSRFKMIVFYNLFVTNEGKKHVLQKVCCDQRHLVWLYKAGVIDNDAYSHANIKSLTGCEFGAEAPQTHDHGNWHSHLWSDPQKITSDSLRKIGRQAGVHFYVEENLPLYANSRFLAVHSKKGGIVTLNLPQKDTMMKELFSGEEFHAKESRLEIELPSPGTVLFELNKENS
jgi:hypothetical protein